MSVHKKMSLYGLRRRWITNSMSTIVIIMLLVCSIFAASISSYYYNSVQTGLETKAKTSVEFLSRFSMTGYSEYYAMAYNFTQSFEDKDKLELQFIDTSGKIVMSSYGQMAGMEPGTSDITNALAGREASVFEGHDPYTGERVIAVACPLVYNGRIVGVMRYVTALHLVDRQIYITCGIVVIIAVIMMMIVYISNMVFIRRIVEPVAEVTETARRISSGSYGIQIENNYRDEIGTLVDSINEMSAKIGQNEKMQKEFISSVSHELRTPLTAINGWGETLLSDVSGDPVQQRRGIGIILKESRRLTNMVEELLQFSRMQDGRFTLQMEQVDLQAEFEDAIYTYRELFKQDEIEVNYDPGQEPLPLIEGDAERLKQVFCNILDNAAKHGGNGGVIDADIAREGTMAVVHIRDHGAGIPEAELPYVKQKFYKGSSKARGSGIGLAVVEEIMNLHGGQFEIGNAPGGGCIVTLRLPLDQGNVQG